MNQKKSTGNDSPILIIGIDGGSWTILKPAVDNGYMPFLQNAMAEGTWGVLESTIPAITPAAWGAFQTGRNPGSTGVFEFLWWDRKTKKYGYANSTCLDRTIWEIFSDAGKKVVAINVPMTYPPKTINGVMITGLMTPSMNSEFTYPSAFKKELLDCIPGYCIFNTLTNIPRKPIRHEHETKFIHNLIQMLEYRTQAACMLIQKQAWDLLMVHFQATDVLQHQFWKYIDPEHPDFSPDKQDWVLGAFYRELDRRIERVYKCFQTAIGKAPLLMVISDHGFESHHRRFNLINWLAEKEYLCFDQYELKKMSLKNIVRKCLPTVRRFSSDKLFRKILRTFRFDTIPVVWEKTRAFTCGCSNGEGAIYLLTTDADEREELIRTLSKELLDIKDPENGSRIVKKIHRKEDIYSGERMDQMPDLILEPEETYSFTVKYQPGKALFTFVKQDNIINIGKHHKEGIIVMKGPGIKKRDNIRLHITDVLPTILSYSGIQAEGNFDGTVCLDIFEDSLKAELSQIKQMNKSPVYEQKKQAADDGVFSPKDKMAIEQRLRDLGYLD